MGRRTLGLIAAAAVALGAAPAASAVPQIHAHRGGPVLNNVATFPENTMPGFRHAVPQGWVLETDSKLTRDDVPVVFHDATLDRTTQCTGRLDARSLAELAACKADVLGAPRYHPVTRPVPPTIPIPTLAELLAFARREGAYLNLEIKNQPTDSDFDETPAFVNRVIDVILASGFPPSRLIIQGFWPETLDAVEARIPGAATQLLTLLAYNDGGPAFAEGRGYEWVAPQWPVSRSFVEDAHARGLLVAPYTLNTPAAVRGAAAIGSDAVISDDPAMAQRTLGLTRRQLAPDPFDPTVRLDAPTYASDRSRAARFRVRWRGDDRGSGIESYTLEARRNSNAATRWRVVAGAARGTSAAFRGRPGVTCLFRLRARDRYGNLSEFAYDETVVPRDDRSRRLRFSRGWRRVRHRGAYAGTLTRGRAGGLSASLAFRGTRVALIARRTRGGARVLVALDGRRRLVRLRGRGRSRAVVFRSRRLRPGRHRLRLRTLDGGVADIDAVAVDTGPPPPRR